MYANTLITSTLVLGWMQECEEDVSDPVAAESDFNISLTPGQTALVDVKRMVKSLMEQLSPVIGGFGSKSGALWEEYAANRCLGRLTPGCCHVGCTNLDGLSKAALKTQLCGGCRRARYCCVACQKAAWLDGGHCTVCGVD